MVLDAGRKEVDDLLGKMERKVAKEYRQAAKEVEKKLSDYLSRFDDKDKKKQEQLKAGQITQAQYNEWRTGQIAMGDRWRSLRDNLAQDYTNANRIAESIVDGYMPEVYAVSHNFATYEVEHGAKIDTSYTLYDRQTVERLMRDNPQMLPKPGKRMSEDIRQGKVKRWNQKQVQSVMMQSLLQGESIPKIAKRLANKVSVRDTKSAVRYARTMTTGAENAGRQDGYKRAVDMGVKMKQAWVAALDSRTRDEHRQLDGQQQEVGKPFVVDGYEIRFPGDPTAPGRLVWNCRCCLVAVVAGSNQDVTDIKDRNTEKMGGMSYEQWKNAKKKSKQTTNSTGSVNQHTQPKQEPPKEKYESEKLKKAMGADYQAFADKINDAPNRVLYEEYMENLLVTITANGGVAYGVGFEASYEKHPGMDRYSIVAHEANHCFDKRCANGNPNVHFSEAETINKHTPIGSGRIKTIGSFASQSDEFLTALRKDAADLKQGLIDRTVQKDFLSTSEMRNSTSGIQDMLDGFFSTQKGNRQYGQLPWGHGERYYNREYNRRVKGFDNEKGLKTAFTELGFDASNQAKCKRLMRVYETASEAWANVGSAVTCGGMELDAIKKYMPNTYEAYLHIVDGVKSGSGENYQVVL